MNANTNTKKRWLLTLVVVIVIASLVGLIWIVSPAQVMAALTSYSDPVAYCTAPGLTEAKVANFRGVSVDDVHLLVTVDGRQLKDICLMGGKDLEKKIIKVRAK
jgi:hypothetical protein